MAEYIEREAIIRQLCLTTACSYYGEVVGTIIEFPAADVQPVKRGKWSDQMLFDDGFGGGRVGYVCSACKKYVPFKGNFCGECGADMRSLKTIKG